jgi:hypothetical protein
MAFAAAQDAAAGDTMAACSSETENAAAAPSAFLFVGIKRKFFWTCREKRLSRPYHNPRQTWGGDHSLGYGLRSDYTRRPGQRGGLVDLSTADGESGHGHCRGLPATVYGVALAPGSPAHSRWRFKYRRPCQPAIIRWWRLWGACNRRSSHLPEPSNVQR